jgi:hypothetical protein
VVVEVFNSNLSILRLSGIGIQIRCPLRPTRQVRLATHEERDPNESLLADDRNCRRCAIGRDLQQQNDTGNGKMQVAKLAAGLVQASSKWHGDEFQVGQCAQVTLVRRRREEVILLAMVC